MKLIEKPILEICSVQAGYPFRQSLTKYPHGGVRVVQPRDVRSNAPINVEELASIDLAQVKPDQVLRPGDVVLVNRGEFVAAVFDGDNGKGPVIGSNSILTLATNRAAVLPEYLVCCLNSRVGRAALSQLGQTSTVPFVSKTNLERMVIPVPPLERQREVAALGRLIWAYGTLTRRKVNLLEQMLGCEFSGAEAQEVS